MKSFLKACPPGMLINSNTKKCKCKPGLVEKNGKCIKPIFPKCPHGKVHKDGKCICQPGLIEQHGKCVKPLNKIEKCPPGSIRNKTKKCVCIRGYHMVDGKCIKLSTQKRTRNPLTSFKRQSNSLSSKNTFESGLNALQNMVIKSSKESSQSKSPLFVSAPIKKIIKLVTLTKRKSPKESLETIKQECPKSLDCLLLNHKHRSKIKDLFDDFKTFKILRTVEPLRTSSENADVLLLTYNYHEYETMAIMKLQKSKGSDSLVYEYLMGKQVNHFLPYLPNFLETYGLFETKSKHILTQYKKLDIFKENFTYNTKKEDELLSEAIKEPTKNALLIEYIHQSCKLEDKLSNKDFIQNELLYVLFQIYYALYNVKGKFAHYDLHTENVLLYEPYKNEYIRFRYHIDGNVYDFYSKYIVKIIDYGSSFTKDSTNYEELCDKEKTRKFKLDYDESNQSIDLKLLYQLKDNIDDYDDNDNLEDLFYSLMKLKKTKERIIHSVIKSGGNTINNISDAYRKLLVYIRNPSPKKEKRADLIIHGLKPYEFIEGSEQTKESNSSNVDRWSSSNHNTNNNTNNDNRWE